MFHVENITDMKTNNLHKQYMTPKVVITDLLSFPILQAVSGPNGLQEGGQAPIGTIPQ